MRIEKHREPKAKGSVGPRVTQKSTEGLREKAAADNRPRKRPSVQHVAVLGYN